MGTGTRIEWTDATWNPITGCTPISEACDNCYARRMANRLAGRYGYPRDDPFRVTFHHDRMGEPADLKKPRKIFVCSMADIFHDNVEYWMIDQIFAVMAAEYHHTYMLLTKRPKNALNYLESKYRLDEIYEQWYGVSGKPREAEAWPLPNVWIGTTAENQDRYDERLPVLMQTEAAVRFASIEPILGPVYMDGWKLDWVIVGQETGPGSRPAQAEWFHDIIDQCRAKCVPVFVKKAPEGVPVIREFPNQKA